VIPWEAAERPGTVAQMLPVLARCFLDQWSPGSKLPTVRQIARELGHSTSSVHAALTRLEALGGIEIEAHGRGGAYLKARSMSRLWAVAEGGPIVLALPLASSRRYEALATALKRLLSEAGLDVFLIFVRGSKQRLKALHDDRCHLAVMSMFAAGEICGRADTVVAELLPASYNTGHCVYYAAAGPPAAPRRVVVDPHSADQQLLSAIEFEDDHVVFVPAMYSQIVNLLRAGQADAAVWTRDEIGKRLPRGVLERPLSPATQQRLGDRDTRAALVGKSARAGALRAVTASLAPPAVERVQRDVMDGRLVPEY
jgi:DNA-binding transcriptional regulator YhcF (GntR family)